MVYALVYVGDIPLSDKIDAVRIAAKHFLFVVGPWILLASLGVIYVARRGANGWGPLLIGFFVANLIGIAVAGRFYSHYFITMLPPMALLAPLGPRLLVTSGRQRLARWSSSDTSRWRYSSR